MGVGSYGQVKNRRSKEEDKMKEKGWSGRRKMRKKKVEEELLLPFSFVNHLLHLGHLS